ncbi:MAG: hypothetical protein D3923_04830, partial [Candidatus Electrothrix sp. AR3]|nr:hypothetical protein [Candidatus Electrothrix sp. AR3]
WFSKLLAEADHLQRESRQEEAQQLLDQVPLDILPLDKQDILQRKKNNLPDQVLAQDIFSTVDLPAVPPVEEKIIFPVEEPADLMSNRQKKRQKAYQLHLLLLHCRKNGIRV